MTEMILSETKKMVKETLDGTKTKPAGGYNSEPRSMKRAIEDADLKLDKVHTILSHWVQEYGYTEKPNHLAAAAYWSGADTGTLGENSAKWIHDYDLIYSLVDIVFDYVLDSKKILNAALEERGHNHEKIYG